MLDNQKVLDLIKTKGPILPIQLAKEIDTTSLLASAVLSELTGKKKVFISHANIGSSPVYYVPGQESKLQMLYNYLQEKEKKAYDLLKQKKILRDKTTEPVIRVALRQIKDFAKPFTTEATGQKELFWKWYLIPNSEAETLLKQRFKPKQKLIPKTIEKQQKVIEKTKRELKKPAEKKKIILVKDEFSEKLNFYFSKNNIQILQKNVIKKNKEIELLVKIPSAVGETIYYCKSKNKKKINDSDLSSAFVQGQFKKLPVLFLTTGDLTKKATEMLNKEFKNIIIKRLV